MSKLREASDEPLEPETRLDDAPESKDKNLSQLLRYPFGESPLERGIPEAWK